VTVAGKGVFILFPVLPNVHFFSNGSLDTRQTRALSLSLPPMAHLELSSNSIDESQKKGNSIDFPINP
jgi:hypothetical protein